MFFIGRVIFTMMFWVLVSRWTYAEISQASPALRSSIDSLLEVAYIPTHDQWDFSKVKEFAMELQENLTSNQAFASDE